MTPPSRLTVAFLLLVTAAIHLDLVPEHLREAPYAGVMFALLSASALVLAVLVLIRDHPAAWAGAGAVSLAAILGYIISRSIGLPSMSDDVGDWLNPLGVAAICAETATAPISLARLARGSKTLRPA